MKIAPIIRVMKNRDGIDQVLVHTGQHYDSQMSAVFFEELGIPIPDLHLEVGSGTHAEQTAKVMLAFEPVVIQEKPDVVVVVGDVNSTMAAAIVCAKLQVPCAHVEAGLRSFDRSMPEEINRLITDAVCDLLFTPSKDANANLLREGVPADRIAFVGNVMIDTLFFTLERAKSSNIKQRLDIENGAKYAVLTLHRPSNVDDRSALLSILDGIEELQKLLKVVFPIHPRTAKSLESFKLMNRITDMPNVLLTPPLGYIDFLKLNSDAAMILTDSGGIQEESTALGIPCLTLRDNTERPITISEGTNTLVGRDPGKIVNAAKLILKNGGKRGRIPEYWDGKTSERIVDTLILRYGA